MRSPSASFHNAAVRRKNPNPAPVKIKQNTTLTLIEQIINTTFKQPIARGKYPKSYKSDDQSERDFFT